jgi:hypothetical protein
MVSNVSFNVDPLDCVTRMIVFVPETLENIADFAKNIYNLALDQQREVYYLALDGRDGNPLAAARQLATITAMTRDGSVQAKALPVAGEDCADTLRQVAHQGDLVIWPEEDLRVPASLESELGITQRVLPAVYTPAQAETYPWYRTLIFWLTSLVVLAGFSFLEFRLAGVISGGLKKVVLIMLFSAEMALLYQWNRIFG